MTAGQNGAGGFANPGDHGLGGGYTGKLSDIRGGETGGLKDLTGIPALLHAVHAFVLESF